MQQPAQLKRARRAAILVLGMHRSGTSAVTRLINLLGADLPGRLLVPQADNPLGYWESGDVVDLHSRLLLSEGSSWHDPLPLRPAWFDTQAARRFEDELLALLWRDFERSSLFVIKDPRLCKLLPLWRNALARFDTEPHFVLTVRNPLEVADSLRRRNGFSLEKGLLLWLLYSLSAEHDTRGERRTILSYDAVLSDWKGAAKRMADDLGLAFPREPAEIEEEMADFLKGDMRHHRFSGTDLGRLEGLYAEVGPVYRQLLGDAPDAGELDAIRRHVDDQLEPLRAFLLDQGRQLAEAEARLDGLAAALESAREQVGARKAQVEQLEAEIDAVRTGYERALAEERSAAREMARGYEEALAAQRQEAMHHESRWQAMARSRSWRITAPLRRAAKFLRAWRGELRRRCRTLFHLLPLPAAVKARVRSGVRRLLPSPAVPAAWAPCPELDPSFAVHAGDPAAASAAGLAFKEEAQPVASIIIPAWNQLAYTLNCLASIRQAEPAIPHEVIVVDDASSDDTATVLPAIPGLRYLRNAENLGFIGTCNAGAAAARGRYLVFLNNDTAVQKGWLEALVETAEEEPEVGIVGSQLIYPDGTLQEAGGLVWSDASGWNYGRGDDRRRPEYNYLRETSYCSAASLLIERNLFFELGGFDARFAPAYYEDTDLAFKVREAGRRVLYQPLSRVVHYEGISCGTDLNSGVKQNQVRNQALFRARWNAVLEKLPRGWEPGFRPGTGTRCRVLIVDACTPTMDRDSGSVDAFFLMKMLRSMGCDVTFAPDNLLFMSGYTPSLQRFGVECLYTPFVTDLGAWVREHGREFDFVLLTRCYVAEKYIDIVRAVCPNARIGFIVVDLHHLRQAREAETRGSLELRRAAELTREQECAVIRKADLTIVKSAREQELLAAELPGAKTFLLPLIIDNADRRAVPFAGRRDFLFVGGYNHPPNVDAVHFLVEAIWPAVHAALPEARLHVIGSDMPESIRAIRAPGVEIVGYVADLGARLNEGRVMVVPLRYGAGVKGKLGRALGYGLPCVATTVAVEGMGLTPDAHVLVADDPADFARRCVELYTDEARWSSIAAAGLELFEREFSLAAGREWIRRMMGELGAEL